MPDTVCKTIKKLSEGNIMHTIITRLFKDDRGVTAIEYALIAGLIALAIATQASALATAIGAQFTAIAAKL
jgi:pilus assembly protein Flp/PilA